MGNDCRQERDGGIVAQHFGKTDHECRDQQQAVKQRCRKFIDGDLRKQARHQHGRREHDQDEEAQDVHCDDQPAAIEAIGDHAGGQGEEEPGQFLRDADQRDRQGIAGDQRGKPRPGDDADAIGEVGQPARRQKPMETGAERRLRRYMLIHGGTLRWEPQPCTGIGGSQALGFQGNLCRPRTA